MKFILTIIGLFCLSCGNAQSLENDAEVLNRVRRVIGGGNAGLGSYPWMGSLRSAADEHICGAVLISENEAITAAHCNEDTPIASIVLGEIDDRTPNPTRRPVQFIPHPQFDPDTCSNDIAVVSFTEPVVFNANIQPAAITESTDEREMFRDGDCTIAGWGLIDQSPPQFPNILQVADANFYGPAECAGGFRDPLYRGDTMLCGGNLMGGIGTCMGDSGGPLQCVNEATGQYEIIGIASFFFHRATGLCAQPNNPHVFTRVSSYESFIRGYDFECPAFQVFPDNGIGVYITLPMCTLRAGGSGTVSCTTPPLTPITLPGTVVCTCADAGNTYEITCPVEMSTVMPVESQPPVLGSCPSPADIRFLSVANGMVIDYAAPFCTDPVDGDVPVQCNPPPELTALESIPRQIKCTCTNTAGLTVAITCPVETRLTVLPCAPTVIIVEGTATWAPPDCMANGNVVGTATCTPSSSDIRTAVSCVCNFQGEQDVCNFELFPLINNPPVLGQCPTDARLVSAGGLSFLTYTLPTCNDQEDGGIGAGSGLTCTPGLGTTLPALPDDIICTCTDSGGLPATITCPIAVNRPPVINCPVNVEVTPVGQTVSRLSYSPASCSDPEDGPVTTQLSCDPPTESFLITVPTSILCTCTDSDGLTATRECPLDIVGGCDVNRCQPPFECREAQDPPGYTCHSFVGQECP